MWSIPANSPAAGVAVPVRGGEARQERSLVAAALDERVQRLAVGGDRRHPDRAVLVALLPWLADALGSVLHRVGVGVRGVGNRECDHLDAVTVLGDMAGDLARPEQWGGEDEPDPALLDHVRGPVADAGLEAAVGDRAKAKRVGEPVGGLVRVPDVELDVIDAEQRHRVNGARGRRGDRLGAHPRPLLEVSAVAFMIAL